MKKTKILISKSPKISLQNEIYNSESFEKNVGILDFAISDIDPALNRCCL